MVASDEPTRVKPSAVESVMISTDATALAPDAIRVFANAAPRPGEHEGLLALLAFTHEFCENALLTRPVRSYDGPRQQAVDPTVQGVPCESGFHADEAKNKIIYVSRGNRAVVTCWFVLEPRLYRTSSWHPTPGPTVRRAPRGNGSVSQSAAQLQSVYFAATPAHTAHQPPAL